MKILLLIRALTVGGAERQITLLAKGLRLEGYRVVVAVFYGGGALEGDLDQADVPLIDLGKRGRWDNLGFLYRLIATIRRERPDVIYSWLTVANILSVLIAPLLSGPPKRIWALRASYIDLDRYDWLFRLSARVETLLSRFAHLAISNSTAGREFAIDQGFPPEKTKVVANGIDVRRFAPNRDGGRAVREEWGIGGDQKLVGLVGRLDPMKGHPYFLHAICRLRQAYGAQLKFVCVGSGAEAYRQELLALAGRLDLEDCLLWAGARNDMPAVYNALDVAVSSSMGEGLPNMLVEAMSCGVPCVATEVGDCAFVVGDTGIVVPPQNPAALADGIDAMLKRMETDGLRLTMAVRRQVEENLSVTALVQNTLSEIQAVL